MCASLPQERVFTWHIYRYSTARPTTPPACIAAETATVSPSPGGEGRGEGGRHTIFAAAAFADGRSINWQWN